MSGLNFKEGVRIENFLISILNERLVHLLEVCQTRTSKWGNQFWFKHEGRNISNVWHSTLVVFNQFHHPSTLTRGGQHWHLAVVYSPAGPAWYDCPGRVNRYALGQGSACSVYSAVFSIKEQEYLMRNILYFVTFQQEHNYSTIKVTNVNKPFCCNWINLKYFLNSKDIPYKEIIC